MLLAELLNESCCIGCLVGVAGLLHAEELADLGFDRFLRAGHVRNKRLLPRLATQLVLQRMLTLASEICH